MQKEKTQYTTSQKKGINKAFSHIEWHLFSEEKNVKDPSEIYGVPNVITYIICCLLRQMVLKLLKHIFIPVHYICSIMS